MRLLLLIVLVTALVAAGVWFVPWMGRRLKQRRVAQRPRLAPEDFFQSYYADSGLAREVVLLLLRDLERATGIPAGLLRPADHLWDGATLDESLYDSLQAIELETALDELRELTGRRLKVADLETVDVYIRTLGPLEQAKREKLLPG